MATKDVLQENIHLRMPATPSTLLELLEYLHDLLLSLLTDWGRHLHCTSQAIEMFEAFAAVGNTKQKKLKCSKR